MMPVVRKRTDGEKPRHIGHVSGHHDDGHGLSDGTAYAQHHRRRHAAAGGRQAHPEVGLRLPWRPVPGLASSYSLGTA